jgi:ethanolamine utilization protein EutP
MKKIVLIGKSGCGKTTLCQRIFKEELEYKKTQSVEVVGGSAIDTPGEYMEHKQYYKALVVTAVEADLVVMVQSGDDTEWTFSPRINSMFNKPMIGVITKMDMHPEEWKINDIEDLMRFAGAEKVFRVSAVTGEGIRNLTDFLGEEG